MPTARSGEQAKSWIVVRRRTEEGPRGQPKGSVGFIGPFRSKAAADREAKAWNESDGWQGRSVAYTAAMKAKVRAWEKKRKGKT